MSRQTELAFACNRGEISSLLLARTDLEHLRLAAQIQENWLPRVLGPMMLRPGSGFVGEVFGDAPTKIIPFVAAFDDTAVIELTDLIMRVWVDDALVTRPSVTTYVPAFSDPSWLTSSTGTAAVSVTADGLTIGDLNQGAVASATCTISVATADQNTEHGLRVVVTNGPVIMRIGSSSGGNDVFYDETLDTGTYSMAFTPGAATVYLQFISTIGAENFNTLTKSQPQGLQTVTIQSASIELPGVLVLPTPWPEGLLTAPNLIRYTELADVIFIAGGAKGIPQYQINRYSPTSWLTVLYKPVKGPMNAVPGDQSVQLTPSVVAGNGVLTSNRPFFDTGMVGTLFRLYHNSQNITQTISFSDTYTDCIRVTGVSTTSLIVSGSVVDYPCTDRQFTITTTGTWVGNLVLERSYEGPLTGFTTYQTYTSNQTGTLIDDGLNNEIIWYRLGPQAGGLTSGAAVCTLRYPGGGGAGVCHVTAFDNRQQVEIEVLVPFFNDFSASDWRQSEWSGDSGYPTAAGIHEGRLWWSGADRWWGLTSDDYTNFDYDAIGDASYIDISVGQGPIANMNWLLSLDSLLGGADTSVICARSDAIQSPLTPTNFNLRFSTATGSAPIQAVKIDNRAIYVDQSRRKIFEAAYDLYTYNYRSTELSNLNPDIGLLGYVGMAIQRNPDTRILLPRADGQLVVLLYDADDQVKAFWRCVTNGSYEDVIVLPGTPEDQVYVVVNRNGKRFIEKFARIDECQGGLMNKIADCFTAYTGALTTTVSAPQLAGQTVVCWADGIDYSPLTLDSNGDATLPTRVANYCVGLGYKSRFLSTKLAYAARNGTAINQVKRVDHIGFVLQNTHCQGLKFGSYQLDPVLLGTAGNDFNPDFGPDFSAELNALWDQGAPLDSLPQVERGAPVTPSTVYSYYDEKMIEFPGDMATDARLYLEANAPRPATVVGVTFSIETSG